MEQESVTPSAQAALRHRSRLLEGMAVAVARKGYADTTIADVVREAAVSRRTFYEHFGDKAACLVALYEAASHNLLELLRQAVDPAQAWEPQLERAIATYFQGLAADPVLVRTLFIEILALGPQGLAARRRVHQEIADYMRQVVPVAPPLAMAVVGGMHELVLQAVEDGQLTQVEELTRTACALVQAVAGR